MTAISTKTPTATMTTVMDTPKTMAIVTTPTTRSFPMRPNNQTSRITIATASLTTEQASTMMMVTGSQKPTTTAQTQTQISTLRPSNTAMVSTTTATVSSCPRWMHLHRFASYDSWRDSNERHCDWLWESAVMTIEVYDPMGQNLFFLQEDERSPQPATLASTP